MPGKENVFINAIASESWLDVGGDNHITYAFENNYGRAWNGAEKAAVSAALQSYANVINVTFAEVTGNTSSADLGENLVSAAQLKSILGTGIYSAWHDPPSDSQAEAYYNYQTGYWTEASLAVGGKGYWLVVHELGHGLGLEHPHSTWHGSGLFPGVTKDNPKDTGDFGLNHGLYTAMSYNVPNEPPNHGPGAYGNIGGPMAFDIAALQFLYGANTTFASGNDTYVLPGVNAQGTYWTCIWDTGGTDGIVYDGPLSATINLNAATLRNEPGGGGFLSYVSGIKGGFTIANGVAIENARAGSGNDSMVGNEFANRLEGGAGNDFLWGGQGADTLIGGDGLDTASYASDTVGVNVDLTLSGPQASGGHGAGDILSGIENLIGGLGRDTLIGDGNANLLDGGRGADTLKGGGGNDFYLVDDPLDILIDTSGLDTAKSSVTHTLSDGVENLTLTGSIAINGIGNALDNEIVGNGKVNKLYGEAGNDTLKGAAGNDKLVGGDGNDDLYGGAGKDALTGGAGADQFVFHKPLSSGNVDRITDFYAPQDTIGLENAIFHALSKTGTLAGNFFWKGTAAHDSNDHIIYNPGTGALIYDSNGSAAGGATQFATLNTGLALTHSDFFII